MFTGILTRIAVGNHCLMNAKQIPKSVNYVALSSSYNYSYSYQPSCYFVLRAGDCLCVHILDGWDERTFNRA